MNFSKMIYVFFFISLVNFAHGQEEMEKEKKGVEAETLMDEGFENKKLLRFDNLNWRHNPYSISNSLGLGRPPRITPFDNPQFGILDSVRNQNLDFQSHQRSLMEIHLKRRRLAIKIFLLNNQVLLQRMNFKLEQNKIMLERNRIREESLKAELKRIQEGDSNN